MKAKVIFLVTVTLLLAASSAYAVIGWSGGVWPCNNATYAENGDISVYVQVWKQGVTDQGGQGAGISATLYYKQEGAANYSSVAMVYNTDVGNGNNDEYRGTIPAAALQGGVREVFECVITDESDNSTCPPTSLYGCGGDQCGNSPPFYLNITAATRIDVTVKFRLCLSGTAETTGDVCVTGDHSEITNWGGGVLMHKPCAEGSPKYYEVEVLFAAGSNPSVQYKYRKDGCSTWEGTGNHAFVIDDSSSYQVLPIDGWEYISPDCPACPVAVESTTWGKVKALYR